MSLHTSEEADTYKSKIKSYVLHNFVVDDFSLPEFVCKKKGKVREIYTSAKGGVLLMVASDRVSAFDHILDRAIPFKGAVLNGIATFGFEHTADIVPNALIAHTDKGGYSENALVQKKCENLNVEFIVRQYLWGSMANAYENGDTHFCGVSLPPGLIRYQKLDELMFTPTTKSDVRDENMSMKQVEDLIGVTQARHIKDLCFKLFTRGSELLASRGLILIDTKYEFGVDADGCVCLIDEVNTPDSSRMCDTQEYTHKYTQICAEMQTHTHTHTHTHTYTNVTDLLRQKPELKIKEESKQYVRDLLVHKGFKQGGAVPSLTDEEVVECSYRYICVYEKITGKQFQFPTQFECPKYRLLQSLKKDGLIKGYCIVTLAGSDSDVEHLKKLKKNAEAYGIPFVARICSAHKQPSTLEKTIEEYNLSSEPLVIIACAGLTDALSGTASYLCVYPIVSCPPDAPNTSCINNPPMSSNAYIQRPQNAVRFAAQVLSMTDPELKSKLLRERNDKIQKLVESDKKINQLV